MKTLNPRLMALLTIVCLAVSQALAGSCLVVTDHPQADAVLSLKTLFRERLRVVDCSTRALVEQDVAGASNIITLLNSPTHGARFGLPMLAKAAAEGATVVMGLEEYAACINARVSETSLPNQQQIQLELHDAKSIAAYGKAWNDYLTGKSIEPGLLRLRKKLREEVTEAVPSLEVVAEDPALRGFPVGSIVPWCSGGSEYRQQQLEAEQLPEGTRVLARSVMNQRPMILRQDIGRGRIYAMALRRLPEPKRQDWESRGGFNKWIPISNLFAQGMLAGTYWSQKPTYEEYCRRLREVANACPDWKLEQMGRYRMGEKDVDKIYSFFMGEPNRPVFVILGMVHAEDEWVPTLGALDFITYVQRNRDTPALAKFFSKYSLRVIPLLQPAIYESPRYAPGEPRPKDELNLEITKSDQVYAAMQLHQGGDSIITGAGTPRAMGRAIGKTVRELYADRFVFWRDQGWKGKPGVLAPMQPEEWVLESSVIGGPIPEWDVYWVQGKGSCYGSYRLEQMMAAKALHFLEQPMLGFMPDQLTTAPSHHWIHRSVFESPGYMTLWENDQTVAYCLAFLLTPITRELERPADWKPLSKDAKPAPGKVWRREELKNFMDQLTQYVSKHHLRRDDSPMRGKVYEFYDPRTGQQGYGAGWDTMHDGAWFANACVLAYRATGDPQYLALVRDWVLPFYVKMLNHSDELFPDRDKAFSDGQPLPPERSAPTKGFVPYWWDDGHGVNFDAIAMRLSIPQLLGNKFGFTFILADTNARDGKLAGYSHGTSHHMALDMFPMLANGWLLTRNPQIAEAIHHLRENRRYQMKGDLPFLVIADYAAQGEEKKAYEVAATYDRIPSPPDTPWHTAMVEKRKTPLTPFIDDPAGKYYALMTGRRVGTNTSKWLARYTYDSLRLHDEWYAPNKRPRGLAFAADSPKKVWVVDGKFDSRAGEIPDVLVGSRMGPQTLWSCALSLQLLKAYPGAWTESEPTLVQITARLQEELDEGLRFWQEQMSSVGYLRADWPIGGKKPSATYWRDQASETGAYAHLIAACADYLMLLDGKNDWDLAWSIRGPGK